MDRSDTSRRILTTCLVPKYREILDGLAKVGFKTNLGLDAAGIFQLLFAHAGGYYIGKSLESDERYHIPTSLDRYWHQQTRHQWRY